MAMWQRSDLENQLEHLFYDYLHAAAAYMMPWTTFYDRDGNPIPPAQRQVFAQVLDPREVYPLSHDSRGRMTSVVVAKMRRFSDLIQEYGPNHPGLMALAKNRTARTQGRDQLTAVEEVWFVDETEWGVAFADPGSRRTPGAYQYIVPGRADATSSAMMVWAADPEPHMLDRCPLVEAKVPSYDNSYRSPLEPVIPHLRVAHNLMARVLDDIAESVYDSVVLSNVANAEEFGPGSIHEAEDPSRPVQVVRSRPTSNVEATQHILTKLVEARKQARHPEQRAGDPGASIVSDKGLRTLQGSFNQELASMQRRVARMLADLNWNMANFDEKWCYGTKEIEGIEDGTSFNETYDPRELFAGDYRNNVSYGVTTGLDRNAAMLQLSTLLVNGVMSNRTFARETGAVDDPLHEERERGLEDVLKIGQGLLAAQASQGSTEAWDALRHYFDRVDGDKTTHRVALMEAINMITQPVPTQGPGAGGPELGGPGDAVLAARSQSAGGIPGSAEGQPPAASQELLSLLPPAASRALGELAPGGTAA